MAQSMTGFARASSQGEWGDLTLEIGSVNSRFLEVHYRAPRELLMYEPQIVQQLRHKLSRGKITLRVEWKPSLNGQLFDQEALRAYYAQLSKIAEDLKAPAISLQSCLSLPGVVSTGEPSDRNQLANALTELVDQVADRLIEHRQLEGQILVQSMNQTAQQWKTMLYNLKNMWTQQREEALTVWRQKIRENVQALGPSVDENRLAQEMVLLADRWDVTEELVRSESHLKQFLTLLQQQGPVGRKMDFMLQEMNRELNTFGSKINQENIRWLVVEAKTLLESLREQTQNLE